ncbi:hypothetical protein D9M69_426500 [compost metagenome]
MGDGLHVIQAPFLALHWRRHLWRDVLQRQAEQQRLLGLDHRRLEQVPSQRRRQVELHRAGATPQLVEVPGRVQMVQGDQALVAFQFPAGGEGAVQAAMPGDAGLHWLAALQAGGRIACIEEQPAAVEQQAKDFRTDCSFEQGVGVVGGGAGNADGQRGDLQVQWIGCSVRAGEREGGAGHAFAYLAVLAEQDPVGGDPAVLVQAIVQARRGFCAGGGLAGLSGQFLQPGAEFRGQFLRRRHGGRLPSNRGRGLLLQVQ